MIILLCFLIGVIAGLRAMMAPAAVSWAAHLGLIHVEGGWLAFLGYRFTPWIFTLAAAAELVTDQLPTTPSRKVPPQFGARIVMGGMCGAAIGMASIGWAAGAVAGILGAVAGTLGGANIRARMAKAFDNDRPAAIIEDVIAICGALLITGLA